MIIFQLVNTGQTAFLKKKLFNINRLENFRNNGLSKNIDEDYINKKQSEKYFKGYFKNTISIK